MYQVIIHEYNTETPKGITFRTTPELENFLKELDFTTLVYLEVRYVRALRSKPSVGNVSPIVKQAKDNSP